jgi:hypothetical protein
MMMGLFRNRDHHGVPSPVLREMSRVKRDVLLPRLHLFEFNDQPWVHEMIRTLITFTLGRGFKLLHGGKLLGDVLVPHTRASGVSSILELAAGSAVPSIELSNEIHKSGRTIPYAVSDKYPDLQAFRRACELTSGRIQSIDQPLDILNIPPDLQGLRLLVTCFHHLTPEQASQFLQDAHDERAPIAIFEITDRRFVRTLLVWPLGLVSMLLESPAIFKTYSWRGILWLPLAAILYGFDGLVSCLRSYTVSELTSMTQTLNKEYRWRVGVIPTDLPGIRFTYLLGSVA